jgi:hypothetical protein
MLRWVVTFGAALLAGCHNEDPGFDVVRVPMSAYASPDAASDGDTGPAPDDTRDGGREPIIVCVPEISEPGESEDVSHEFPSCLMKHEGRTFDARATERHRKKDDDSEVCCYRR